LPVKNGHRTGGVKIVVVKKKNPKIPGTDESKGGGGWKSNHSFRGIKNTQQTGKKKKKKGGPRGVKLAGTVI